MTWYVDIVYITTGRCHVRPLPTFCYMGGRTALTPVAMIHIAFDHTYHSQDCADVEDYAEVMHDV